MPIDDPFSYYGRFDSMDFDCTLCKNFLSPPKWPDVNKVLRCNYHNISLAFELRSNCYMGGQWFCKHFETAKAPFEWNALTEFETVKNELDETIIYRGGNGKFLFERKI
jgi:hypothetical protein